MCCFLALVLPVTRVIYSLSNYFTPFSLHQSVLSNCTVDNDHFFLQYYKSMFFGVIYLLFRRPRMKRERRATLICCIMRVAEQDSKEI
jgi:hypothetical protein